MLSFILKKHYGRSVIKTGWTLLFLVILLPAAVAQKDFSQELKKELVKIEAGKFTAQEFKFMKFGDGSSWQLKIAASCPTDVMSRDNFIAFYSSYGIVLLMAILAEAELEMPEIKDMDEPIGDPDITFNFVMAKNGIQIQTITAEGKETMTMKWEDVLDY